MTPVKCQDVGDRVVGRVGHYDHVLGPVVKRLIHRRSLSPERIPPDREGHICIMSMVHIHFYPVRQGGSPEVDHGP